MTSLNTYIDTFKKIQKQATKITGVVDEKLKKTQENLEKKRIQVVEASASAALPTKWEQSPGNPLGKLVVQVPPPSPITPSPSPISSPAISRKQDVDTTSQVVRRKKHHRQQRVTEENENERRHEIHRCLSDTINEIIEKEDIEKCLNQLIDMIISNEEFIEQTSINTISTEDNSMESLNTNEVNSDTSETHSNTLERDLTDSINRLDTSSEKVNFYEENYVRIQSFDEQSHISDTNQTFIDTSELLNPTTIDPKEEIFSGSLPITSHVIDTSTVELAPVPIKQEKRFSLDHCYCLPRNIIVSHMSCSSTYIYICTNEYLLFYTKVPENDVYYSLNWYQYPLPAERVIVSHSNETIWRLFENCIYSSSDTVKLSALGINWTELKFHQGDNLLSISINDEHGWFIKHDGTLWLIKINDENQQPLDVSCPFHLNHVVCSIDKIGVTTLDGQILIRIGCTNDCPEGGGWIFIEHDFGPFDDFALITNNTMLCIVDKKHRIWIHDWKINGKFYEILRNDELTLKSTNSRYLIDINNKFLCFTDCHEQLFIFSNCLTGHHWSLVQKGTRLQHLIDTFSNENVVWALTTDGMVCSSTGQILDKPRQAQYLTHASFVPQTNSEKILWTLDESCNIYTRNNLNGNTQWEQLDQSQFDWNRRLVDIVCNSVGVWAVDDRGCIHFRHGHNSNSNEYSLLNPAWIPIPGEPEPHRSFAQIFCGPKNWMIYATDNKQTVYARVGIHETNHIGTSWKVIEDCSALRLAISEHTLWLLTSHGRIQCRENISLKNPVGKRTITLPGRFNSISVSPDDEQMWALYPPHHLFKLDRLTVLFEK